MRLASTLCLTGTLALITPFALAFVSEAKTLKTDYSGMEVLKVERQVSLSMETTVMEIEIDGEPREMGDRGMPKTEMSMGHSYSDDFKAVTEGVPTHIERTFGEWAASRQGADGPVEIERSPTLPEDGLKIEIKIEDDEQKIKVLEGEAPENEEFMESQPMTLAVDGLLPTEAVEVDGTWVLEDAAIRAAIGDLSVPRAPRPEGQGRRRGGDRMTQEGRRQGRGRTGGGNLQGFLAAAEWTGEAKLASLEAEFEDAKYALIDLELVCEGDMPERVIRQGRPGRGDDNVGGLEALLSNTLEGTGKITVKGKLYYSIETQRPVALMLEGEIEIVESTVREQRERTMTMHQEQEGVLKLNVRFAHQTR